MHRVLSARIPPSGPSYFSRAGLARPLLVHTTDTLIWFKHLLISSCLCPSGLESRRRDDLVSRRQPCPAQRLRRRVVRRAICIEFRVVLRPAGPPGAPAQSACTRTVRVHASPPHVPPPAPLPFCPSGFACTRGLPISTTLIPSADCRCRARTPSPSRPPRRRPEPRSRRPRTRRRATATLASRRTSTTQRLRRRSQQATSPPRGLPCPGPGPPPAPTLRPA